MQNSKHFSRMEEFTFSQANRDKLGKHDLVSSVVEQVYARKVDFRVTTDDKLPKRGADKIVHESQTGSCPCT